MFVPDLSLDGDVLKKLMSLLKLNVLKEINALLKLKIIIIEILNLHHLLMKEECVKDNIKP
jgi:hypothetical protein